MDTSVRDKLKNYYTSTYPEIGEVEIRNIRSLNEGWESIIYAFDLVQSSHQVDQPEAVPVDMILRIYPGEDAYHKSLREFEGMRRLHKVGYPVPKVFTLEQDHSPFGKPFMIMERIAGEMLWPVLDRSTPETSAAYLTEMCSLFVKLHDLDWHSFVPEAEQADYEDPYIFIDQLLNWLRSMAEPFPDLRAFFPVIEWLETRRDLVPCSRPAPVHWDFHPGNLILQPDGELKVIDWTQIQVSDPRFDLGWTLLLAGAYTGVETRSYILNEYQRITGSQVEQLEFFDVANAIKRLGSVMISFSAGAEQMGMRSDAIDAMRRDFPSLRLVYDLMRKQSGIPIPEIERFLEI